MTAHLASTAAIILIVAWTITGGTIHVFKTLGREVPAIVRTVFHELRPFYLPAVVVAPVAQSMGGYSSAWTWTGLAINVWNWWLFRNSDDDDDRWKRRRKRLAEKITEVGGRLEVVPAGVR